MNDKDLDRCRADKALACFLFANQFSNSPELEDKRTILNALSLKHYNPALVIVAMIIKPESKVGSAKLYSN
jgi:hypothetical protein